MLCLLAIVSRHVDHIIFTRKVKNISILGLSAGFHDAAASVVDKYGNITFAAHAERYSRKKNDPDLNRAILEEAVASTSEPITAIGWYEKPWLKHTRQVYSGEKKFYDTPQSLRKYIRGVSGDMFDNAKIHTFHHHQSHAAAGFQTSGYDDAIIVVVDAIGEWDCFSFWYAYYERGSLGRRIVKYQKLRSIRYPHSLGLFYSAITQAVGLKPNEEEYITMGMAAYGDIGGTASDDYLEMRRAVRDAVGVDSHRFRVEDDYTFEFETKHNLHAGFPKNHIPAGAPKEVIAYQAQIQTEQVLSAVFSVASNMAKFKKTKNFVYMGGVALNCVANRMVRNVLSYKQKASNDFNLWIMPNPGDAGSSIGAAALIHGKKLNWQSPFLGTNIPGKYPIENILKVLGTDKIAGVASGRAEFGPRALGNRSLLADPRDPDIKDKVNAIKQRQKFRPFAPVILAEYAHEYFYSVTPENKYMQSVSVAGVGTSEQYPAIVHADETARVQTVGQDDTSGMRDLLEQWYFWSGGCPMLLNTSLNIRGEPMVNTREDADRFENQYGVTVLS